MVGAVELYAEAAELQARVGESRSAATTLDVAVARAAKSRYGEARLGAVVELEIATRRMGRWAMDALDRAITRDAERTAGEGSLPDRMLVELPDGLPLRGLHWGLRRGRHRGASRTASSPAEGVRW